MPPPRSPEPQLSKSRFVAGLQCHKQLWWRVHDPDARELEPDVALRNRFDQGAEVGRKAREYVPGGTLIDLPHHQRDNKIAATRQAMTAGAPVVYEAAFRAAGAYVEVDILERLPDGDGTYRVIEVKASSRCKREHIPDAAIQTHVARQAGLRVGRADVMHLNPACRYPDLSNLFVREDVTDLVETFLLDLPDEVERQLAMLRGPLPMVAIGDHCTRPHDCPFFDRCWPKPPAHHVSTLYTIPRDRVLALEARGFETLYQLPTDLELSVMHARQVRAVTTGTIVVEPTLAAALAEFEPPLAFLDFETVSLAIPRWPGCGPWDQVPVQFSVHSEVQRRRPAHHAWIAEQPDDPRPELARRLVAACAGARKIVAYYARFERSCIRHLIEWVPDLAGQLEEVEAKLVDLYPVVRNHVYHPDFGGSFSIKQVLPALVPGLGYGDLEIQGGDVATVRLQELMLRGDQLQPGERERLRDALLRYCERDSWAMVKLLERLRALGSTVQLELGI